MKSLIRSTVIGLFSVLAFSANAGVISVQGTELETLELDGSYSSFEDFYGFDAATFVSSTGFETANTAVIYFAELNDEIAMIMHVSGFGGSAGALNGSFVGSEGAVSFVDDHNGIDPFDGVTVNWVYSKNKNDGLIYSGLFSDVWDIDVTLTRIGGNLDGVNFLTFDDNNNDSVALGLIGFPQNFSVRSTDTAVNVNEPVTLAMLLVGFAGIAFRKRK